MTALMVASKEGHENVVKLLLEKGANANLKEHNGATALMMASHKGHDTVVKILLKKAQVLTTK
jgi:ankyrin repeat protein